MSIEAAGEYEGLVVFDPPPVRTFQGEAQPGTEEWYELSREDLMVMLPQCVGIPVRTEHGTSEVGRITSAFFKIGRAHV